MRTLSILTLALSIASVSLLAGCPKQSAGDPAATSKAPASGGDELQPDSPADKATEEKARAENAHDIVFADRTSQGYLLLVDEAHADVPTREALATLVRGKLGTKADEPELQLLTQLIATEPHETPVDPGIEPGAPRPTSDLLGMHIDVLPLAGAKEPLVAPEVLRDPILSRELSDEQRASLPGRTHAVLLRADYRNQHAVRGLRLLQTAVRVLAADRSALIHDPDTRETMGVDAFTRRRLQSSLGNVADQIVVVPFEDRTKPGAIRLATRGMRRFGSVDIELDGLPRDPRLLQDATHLLFGLAYQMVRLGEFDDRGYAVALGDVVAVGADDVVRAYGSRGGSVPTCDGCQAEVELHLVERAPEQHDPSGHVTARVVAPRDVSDAQDYDHDRWVTNVVSALFKEPS